MSELETVESLAEETPQNVSGVETVEAQPVEEPEIPDAVEIKPGEKYVPLSALKQTRDELKTLKPLAEQAQRLQDELNRVKPYADFIQANPQLLHQQPAPQAPPPVATSDDPQVIAYAKRFDLYTQDGRPDTERAKAIIDDNRRMAREEAEVLMAPVQQHTHQQAALTNLDSVLRMKDAEGRPLQQEYITQAVSALAQGSDQKELIRMLADPKVVNVVARVARDAQMMALAGKKPVQAPTSPALHVETPGGGSPQAMSDSERGRLARLSGRSEKDVTASAAKYVPGRANPLE